MGDLKLNRILLVEDEDDIRTITRICLESVGRFQVVACGSGEAALSQLESFKPDLILLDVMMPGLDGPGTLAAMKLKTHGDAPPVIFMTARAQRWEIDHFKALGALDVIAKPFDPMTLSQAVKHIWERNHV